MVLFDGMYSLVSLILSMMSLFISSYIAKKDQEKFPFGKNILEPMVISLKSFVIAAMCIYSLVDAIRTIIFGGDRMDFDFGLIYSFISVVGCSLIYKYLDKKGKKLSSDLINAESSQWLMDTILSLSLIHI